VQHIYTSYTAAGDTSLPLSVIISSSFNISPTAVNVDLFADFEGDSDAVKADNVTKRKSWFDSGKQSITRDERVVIPISIRDGNKISTRATSYIPGSGLNQGTIYYHNSRLNMRDHFPIEPAFSITVDKAQV